MGWQKVSGRMQHTAKECLVPVLIAVLVLAPALKAGCAIKMKITSPEFENNSLIPEKFTCQADNVNPELILENVPKDAKSLALIVDDPDAPGGMWVHWVVYNILPTADIGENTIPGEQGINDFHKKNYGGPCPPSGTHRYFFKVYALDTVLKLHGEIRKEDLEKAMQGHIIDKSELVGLYKKH